MKAIYICSFEKKKQFFFTNVYILKKKLKNVYRQIYFNLNNFYLIFHHEVQNSTKAQEALKILSDYAS